MKRKHFMCTECKARLPIQDVSIDGYSCEYCYEDMAVRLEAEEELYKINKGSWVPEYLQQD